MMLKDFFTLGEQENASGPKEYHVITLKSGYSPVEKLFKGYNPDKLLLKNLRAEANQNSLFTQKKSKL